MVSDYFIRNGKTRWVPAALAATVQGLRQLPGMP